MANSYGILPGLSSPQAALPSNGELSAYEPSWRDTVAYWLAQNWYGDDREGVAKARNAMNVAEYTPLAPLAAPFYYNEASRDFGRNTIGSTASLLGMAPIPPAAKKGAKLTGKAAKETLNNILEKHGLTPPKTIKAYHGSPHDFDKFDMSKIGTGEGAQAYGHGLYFAENEGVARSYRDQLSGATGNTQTPQGAADRAMGVANGDRDQAIAALEREIATMQEAAKGLPASHPFSKRIGDEYIPALDLLKGGYKPGGSMYEVEINASPDDFLDWDKPLSEQQKGPVVQQMLRHRMIEPYEKMTGVNAVGELGTHYNQIFGRKGGNPDADVSKALKRAGIPGIKYLDAGSRAKGDGSRNYVVFDDRLVKILRKYGLLPPAMAAAYGAQDEQTAY